MRSAGYRLAVAAVALTIASCADSSGGGITGSGLVIGTITDFGSIFVNGLEIEVGEATITIDGAPATEADLRLGMVVEVRGVIDAGAGTGSASSVVFDDELQGPVEQVDVAGSLIVVLGQVVLVDGSTVFDDTSLATLVPGDIVEVSGFRDGDGNVVASRIERKEGEEEIELKGVVAELDADAQTFLLGAQLVDFSGAEIDNAPAGGLADGLFVSVETTQPTVGGVLFAEEIKVEEEGFEGEEGEDVEISGLVTNVISPTEFVMNATRPVRTTTATEFEGGDAGDIVVNAQLEVTGMLDDAGVLVARKIELED
jgi:hypothetical protein